MSELFDQIKLAIPDTPNEFEVTISRSEIGAMLRTAMFQGAELVLEQARARQFVLLQHSKRIGVVEFERLRRFVEGNNEPK
jgi:hypothetical protein